MKKNKIYVSAHRGGVQGNKELENTKEAFEYAIKNKIDYIEFDIHETKDEEFIVYHDHTIHDKDITELTLSECREYVPNLLEYGEALDILQGRAKAHLDYKFISYKFDYNFPGRTSEVRATQMALDVLGYGNFVVTTLEEDSVRVIREYFIDDYPDMLVGLSIGKDTSNMDKTQALRTKNADLYPEKRLKNCYANLLVARKDLYDERLKKVAQKLGIPVLLWTVDDPNEMWRYLQEDNIFMITSNNPQWLMRLRYDQSIMF